MPGLRKAMQDALAKGAGVLRSEKELTESLAALETVLAKANELPSENGIAGFTRLRLINDAQTAVMVCRGALERKESLGSHTRLDSQAPAEKPYRVVQSQKGCCREDV